MRVDGYIRVSRVGKRDTGSASYITEAVQRDQISGWATLQGADVVEWHLDRDESGSKIDRPAFQRMLERVEAGHTDGVVVAKLDRFARSLPGALEAIRRIDGAGATFTSVAEGIDPTTPAGKMMHRLMLILAEFELDRITETWATAQQRAIARGVHFMVPFGYRRGEDGPLEPDEHAPLVTSVFRLRASGTSWSELAAWLNRRCSSPTGGDWTGRTVKHVITNRVYVGEAYHGKFRNAGAHPAIVGEQEWQDAQSARGHAPARVDELLLTGIVRCAGCRHSLKADQYGPKTARVRLYRCRGHHGAGACPAPASITAHLADSHVEEVFLARYGRMRLAGARTTGDIDVTRKALAAAEAELDGFAGDLRLREALGHQRFASQVETRATAVRDAEEALQAAHTAAAPAGLSIPPKLWATLDGPEKRRLVSAGVDAVFLRRTGQAPVSDRLKVVWAGEGDDDLPGRGRRGIPLRSVEWEPVGAG